MKLTKRLFVTQKGKPFWVRYNQDQNIYIHASTTMSLDQVVQVFEAHLIQERRFLYQGAFIYLPFIKAQGKAFFENKFRTLEVLKGLGCIESPMPQKLGVKNILFHANGVTSTNKYSNRASYKGKHTSRYGY